MTSDPLTVALPHGRAYPVHFRPLAETPAALAEAGLTPETCLVVTDATVAPLYLGSLVGALTEAGWTPQAHALPPGEATKSPEMLTRLYDWALGLGIERTTPVLALGGGVVGDLAGFAAATLLRGLPLIHLPTTVIAQVDSALGGKTGINHATGKNLIGAFHQPRLVLADTATLATLPNREFYSGLAEAVKHALIADAALVDALVAAWPALLAREPEVLTALIPRAAAVKADVVAEDEREAGRRMLLNFGHTFGHALERATGYGTFTHGEAVAVGMRAALHLSASVAAGRLWNGPLPEPFRRAEALVARLPLGASLAEVSAEALAEALQSDKKRAAGRLRFVVLDRIGAARVVATVPEGAVAAAWAFARTQTDRRD